jgi:hypothetical protein
MLRCNNSTDVLISQPITRREEARDLLPQDKLSPFDLDIYNKVIEKAKLLLQDTLKDYMDYQIIIDSIQESCAVGSNDLVDIARWLNEKYPDNPIFIPSDYVGDVLDFEEPDWIIPGIAVRNNTTLMTGDAGVGKTTLYLYLADVLMQGSEFFGIQCEQCKPLIICQDEDHNLLRNHWETMGKTGLLPVAKKDVLWDKDKKDFNEDFEHTLQAYNPDVVFVDSYTSLGIPDITRPESGLVFDAFNRIARKYECAIILIHHNNASGEQMGSSLHRAKVSSMVSIRKTDENHITINQEKVRGTHFEPIKIRFDRENLSMFSEQGSLREQVFRLLNEADTNRGNNELISEIIERLPNENRDTIRRYCREYNRQTAQT